jgi:hypothetical protein
VGRQSIRRISQGVLFGAPRGAPHETDATSPPQLFARSRRRLCFQYRKKRGITLASLFSFFRIEFEVLTIGLIAIVAFRLLTGAINTGGLLFDKTVGKAGEQLGSFSPSRLQLLMLTLAVASYYLFQIVNQLHCGQPGFPDIPQKYLLMLGGSHSLYLGGKTYSLFGGPSQGSNVNQK